MHCSKYDSTKKSNYWCDYKFEMHLDKKFKLIILLNFLSFY